MDRKQRYVIMSLELHLFFSRIMKEHSLFLEAAFTPPNANFAREADYYKRNFENLLLYVVNMSNGIVSNKVLKSGEVATEFTLAAEQQTQGFTGININQRITKLELKLQGSTGMRISNSMFNQVRRINIRAISLLNGLIDFKERILNNVLSCRMFTMNYPLLIKHIIREAKLYREYVIDLQDNGEIDCNKINKVERFWNQIMMEHALFIRGLLDPSENGLIETSNNFAKDYAHLLEKSKEVHDRTISENTSESLKETTKFRDFKATGAKGIEECQIKSIILPLLADHVLREANHYIRLLKQA